MGVKFVDITFSIMERDKFVIGALLDSIIMKLGKGVSALLAKESDSFKMRFNFLFEKEVMSIICFSLVLCSTIHHGAQLKKGINQGVNPFALPETRIQYQYTHIKSKILNLSQILVFITGSTSLLLLTQLTLNPFVLALIR